jgi:hypothetical protein
MTVLAGDQSLFVFLSEGGRESRAAVFRDRVLVELPEGDLCAIKILGVLRLRAHLQASHSHSRALRSGIQW